MLHPLVAISQLDRILSSGHQVNYYGFPRTTTILNDLEKSYDVDEFNLLDIEIDYFFDFQWRNNMSIEEYLQASMLA